MRPIVQPRCRAKLPRRPTCYRPQLEALEARLPLGDALLGAVVGSSLLGSALSVREPGLWASESLSADTFGVKLGQSDPGHPASSATADSRTDTAVSSRPILCARRDNDALGSSTA